MLVVAPSQPSSPGQTPADCARCGLPFIRLGGRGRPRKYCDRDTCASRRDPVRARDRKRRGNDKARATAAGVEYEPIDRAEIFERDRGICQLCDAPVDPELVFPDPLAATLDHIIPLNSGGPHVAANVQLAHHACNSRKGSSEVVHDDGWIDP